jgi:2,5-diketo-D-gluconate reductase B
MDTLTSYGIDVPKLGLGTWQLTGDQCYRTVSEALEIGYRHIDTAQAYNNEEEVGRALAASDIPREEIFVTTKIWMDNADIAHVLGSAAESLEKLQLEHVDLTLLHWPNDEVPIAETLQALAQLRDAGRSRLIGVSNFTPELWDQASSAGTVACNQVEYHPFLAQDDLLQRVRNHGEAFLTAYCPIARGEVMDNGTLQAIGKRYGKTPAQVTLRWLLDQERVVAIPRSKDPHHLRQNLDIFDFELDVEDHKAISGLARGMRLIDPDFAPAWNH